MQRLGTKAALGWSSTGDSMTERLHLLAVPLREVVPAHSRSVYVGESLDRSAREVLVVGSGAHELVGTARFDDDPQSLLDLINAGAGGETLTYYPDLRDPGVNYPCLLISPAGGDIQTTLDTARGTFGNNQVTLRLRPTALTPMQPLYQQSNVLLWYRAGDSLEEWTFARADTAGYTDKGPGTIKSAASGKARLTYVDLDGDGIREAPALLLEMARTNGWTLSEDVSNAAWTKTNVTISADATAAPDDATTMDRVVEAASTALHNIARNTPTLTNSLDSTVSFFVQPWSGRDWIRVRTTDKAGTTRDSWVNITTRVAGTTDSGHTLSLGKYKNGATRVVVTFNAATGATSPSVQVHIATADASTSTFLGDITKGVYLWGLQFEADKNFATTYMPTAGSTDTRTADSLFRSFAARPEAMTIYLRFRETQVGDGSISQLVYLALTNGSTGARLFLDIFGANYEFVYTDGTTTKTATVTSNALVGDIVEIRATLTSAGVAQIGRARNAGAETLGSAQTALTLPSSWASQHVYLNSAAGSGISAGQYLNLAVVRGVHDLDAMRRIAKVA